MKRLKSPREAFGQLAKCYDPKSEVATQKLYDKFHDFTIPPSSNPTEALHALESTNNQMAEKGMGIPDTFLHARFVRVLPDECGQVKATLQRMKNRDRAEIIRMVGSGRPGRPSKRSSRAKAAAGGVHDDVVAAVAGKPRAAAVAGATARVEVAATEKAEAALVMPAAAAVAGLLAAVGDATGGTTSGRSTPRRRATSSPSVLGS